MDSLYDLADELRDIIIRYAAACEERGLDPITQIISLTKEELEDA